mmetsp:Transcript_43376/g.116415  ORF Transcript_43376/g.116415 Transcript_43376/m.116415 type:complete len:463 (-) Transcript_43376:70-1458(-)
MIPSHAHGEYAPWTCLAAPQAAIAAAIAAAAAGAVATEKSVAEGSTATPSAESAGGAACLSMEAADEDPGLVPNAMDVRRLAKYRADQALRLKMLRARVERLRSDESRVWKDVTSVQQRCLQNQEVQIRRQAQQAEHDRLQRDQVYRQEVLRERVIEQRKSREPAKEIPRAAKFEENRAVAQSAREESRRVTATLWEAKEQLRQRKSQMVEDRRLQQRQHKLQKDHESSRREQARQETNAGKFAQVQQEMQDLELAIAAAEREELAAVSRLQNSQSVGAEIVSRLHADMTGFGAGGAGGEDFDDREAHRLPVSPRPLQQLQQGSALPEIVEEEDGSMDRSAVSTVCRLLVGGPQQPRSVPSSPSGPSKMVFGAVSGAAPMPVTMPPQVFAVGSVAGHAASRVRSPGASAGAIGLAMVAPLGSPSAPALLGHRPVAVLHTGAAGRSIGRPGVVSSSPTRGPPL